MTWRWGVLGTGRIAATISAELALVDGAQRWAVASRDCERARAFAGSHGFARSYGSYEGLVADPDVDVVYVATPHAQHLAAARLALEAGKAVLVEKPFTTTQPDGSTLAALATARGLFCMEAMWTRFLPNTEHLLELVTGGTLGEPRTVHADIGWPVPVDEASRFYSPALGGGAMLDGGVYAVALAHLVLGSPHEVHAVGSLAATGVDTDVSVLLGYAGGASALLSTSIASHRSRQAWVDCTDGWVELAGSFEQMPALRVHRGGRTEHVERRHVGRGYVHMLRHVQDCLAAGLTESPLWPLSSTLEVAHVMDRALGRIGAVTAEV
ncbi:Gfo/Idh/MocA family protein [Georgenia wangjunii]|uniref:Gfo/Idh/MocA family protein n=1 Tax=Georgenia wangjunii TaxID=3117730 RepID=UPI002F265A7F